LAFLLAVPFLLMYRRKPREFRHVSELIALIPLPIGKKIRYEFYKRTLKGCGENVSFNFGTILNYSDITLGDNVALNYYNNLGLVDMGNNVLTAPDCIFVGGRHSHAFEDMDTPIREQGVGVRRICVGSDVWVGTKAIVMESVGDGCVIGAGSVVTKPVEPYSVAVGNPARVIRKREK
jgi:virginiamycin A acetyltransferase